MINEKERKVTKKWLESVGRHIVRENIKSRHNICPTCHLPLVGYEKMLQCSNCGTRIINSTFDGLGLA